jgi:microcin C transport system substrate-binding protein
MAMILPSARVVAADPAPAHGIAMHGAPKYAPEFGHFDYADPNAPKGGVLRRARVGSFDSLNPFIVRGVPARGLRLVYESLMARAMDEPFTLYGLLAKAVVVPADRQWIEFVLDERARFHDGAPVTTDDVLFSWRTLRDHGLPNHRSYYGAVTRAESPTSGHVRFTFGPDANAEMPLIMGLMPVLSAADFANREFDDTTLEPLLGSGPYRIEDVEPGRSITYQRVPEYWARDLPVNRGRHNFDQIGFTYYRDAGVALEAFLAGEYDVRFEPDPARWANAYDHPSVGRGLIRREEITHERPVGMTGMAFNTRRAVFADKRVRAALATAFAFEWINQAYFHDAYRRNLSFFENSDLAADVDSGPPQGRRARLSAADQGLAAAGWTVRDGKRVSGDGTPLAFEILLVNPSFERVALAYARDLARLGVEARVRTVDSAQYQARRESFDFDMVVNRWGQSLSPGNEQRIYWSSEAADTLGSRNLAGIRDAAVDALIEQIADARDRTSLITATQELDRRLRDGHYMVPLYYAPVDRIALWDHFGRPIEVPLYGTQLDTWWARPE